MLQLVLEGGSLVRPLHILSPVHWMGVEPTTLRDETSGCTTTPVDIVAVADWCTFSNTKAILANAGKKGGVYPKFEPFSPDEIKQFLGLSLLHGLCPSP
jgi:hypothetical protein